MKTHHKQQIIKNAARSVIYSTVIFLCLAGYFYNEHLLQLNEGRFTPPYSDYRYDYLLGPSSTFLFMLAGSLIMMVVVNWSIANASTQGRHNRWPLVATGTLFYLAVIVMFLDITIGGWGIPGRCGSGFTLGNCFLFEGLGEVVYLLAAPIFFILGTILLVINRRAKYRPFKTL